MVRSIMCDLTRVLKSTLGDMMGSIKDKEGLMERIVSMLRRDSSNNVGPAEVIKIFKDIVPCGNELRQTYLPICPT